MKIQILTAWLFTSLLIRGDIIEPNRRIDWTAGVPGGIDQYSTNYTLHVNVKTGMDAIGGTNAVGDGVVDDTSSIQFAINTCPNGKYVYIPNGTYRTTANISIVGTYNLDKVHHFKSIILRGESVTNTVILVDHSGVGIKVHSPYGLTDFNTVVGGLSKGQTEIELSTAVSTSRLPTNFWVCLRSSYADISDANNIPAYMTHFGHYAKVVTRNDTTHLTIEKGSYFTSSSVGLCYVFSPPIHCGIESLKVERNSNEGSHNIQFVNAMECWVKDVESDKCIKWHFQLNNASGCEIRDSYAHDTFYGVGNGGGDSVYGFGLYDKCTDCLVENNRALHTRHAYITEYCGIGNVFGYNYAKDPINENGLETDYLMADSIQHGGDSRFNLWEGNITARLCWDNIFGSSHYLTAFRNHFTRLGLVSTLSGRAVEVQSYNYSNNIVGNVLLTASESNTNYYDFQAGVTSFSVRRLGYPSDGVSIPYDATVTNTLVYYENYAYGWGVVSNTPDISGVLSNSLYLTSKPDWFGSLAFPPIGPDVESKTNYIPAMARFYGVDYLSGKTNPIASWLSWSSTYLQAVDETNLNATFTWNGEPVDGTPTYSVTNGQVLPSGHQTVTVTFTPTDTNMFNSVSLSITITNAQADPGFSWSQPVDWYYPLLLSEVQLNATASQAGTFDYNPPLGTKLNPGQRLLTTTFTPSNTNYLTIVSNHTVSVMISHGRNQNWSSTQPPNGIGTW